MYVCVYNSINDKYIKCIYTYRGQVPTMTFKGQSGGLNPRARSGTWSLHTKRGIEVYDIFSVYTV